MPIHFIYGRREALNGRSEAYKKSVRKYLESEGYSQTTDSFIEGSFPDMVFINPYIMPGKKFLVETKAEKSSLRSRKFSAELIKYFRLWLVENPEDRFSFILFTQSVRSPKKWEELFSVNNDDAVKKWVDWYNEKCIDYSEPISVDEFDELKHFLSVSMVKVGNNIKLDLAVIQKEPISMTSLKRMADELHNLVIKRKNPIMKKSDIIMNLLPIEVPDVYYEFSSDVYDRDQIYQELDGTLIPPFILRWDGTILFFSDPDDQNPLLMYSEDDAQSKYTKDLQLENPALASYLVNIHLRRMMWNKGIFRMPKSNLYYYPMTDKSKEKRYERNYTRKDRWVVRKFIHQDDTEYHSKGDTNFYLHRALEIRTATYWGDSYLELIPRICFTLDGESQIEDGDIRARLDAKFRNPNFDRSSTRLGLMRFWKYLIFDKDNYIYPKENWFERFKFGDFLQTQVNWSPQVIGSNQSRLWDFWMVKE